MLLPTIQIQELDNKSEEEIKDILAIYIMQFGNLNYQITLKALNNLTQDENKMKEFRQAPIPTLARESTNLTQFTEQEKEKYKLSKQIRYFVDLSNNMMRACNALKASERLPQYDKPFTPIEEDYYCHSLMSTEEYEYWQDKTYNREIKKVPDKLYYNPKTRTNSVIERKYEKV